MSNFLIKTSNWQGTNRKSFFAVVFFPPAAVEFISFIHILDVRRYNCNCSLAVILFPLAAEILITILFCVCVRCLELDYYHRTK